MAQSIPEPRSLPERIEQIVQILKRRFGMLTDRSPESVDERTERVLECMLEHPAPRIDGGRCLRLVDSACAGQRKDRFAENFLKHAKGPHHSTEFLPECGGVTVRRKPIRQAALVNHSASRLPVSHVLHSLFACASGAADCQSATAMR